MTRNPNIKMRAALAMAAFLVASAIVLYFALASRAEAQVLCAPWPALKKQYAVTHGERPLSVGQIDASSVLVILVSPDGATWSAIIVNANGTACVVGAGKSWEPGVLGDKGRQG